MSIANALLCFVVVSVYVAKPKIKKKKEKKEKRSPVVLVA